MKQTLVYLVNVKKDDRHVALLCTHDGKFVEDLMAALRDTSYSLTIDASPSPLTSK